MNGPTRSSEASRPSAQRVAMWSGPRNVSTALMRSFESRDDCSVCDEPLYAHYLLVTRLPHPGADAVIASQWTDWREVAQGLTGPIPGGKALWYQKHMAHHLLPEIGREWVWELANAFLIRDPAEMLVSLDARFPDPCLEDTGLPQQWELFEELRRRTGATPPVIDTRDLLNDPRGILGELCARLGLDFQEAMLAWPPGRRATDGVWAEHWYAGVERSNGFAPWQPKTEPVPERLRALLARCREFYLQLHEHRLKSRA